MGALRQRLAEPQPEFRFSFLAITRKPTQAVRNRGTGPRLTQCWVCFVSRLDATCPTGRSQGKEISTLQGPQGVLGQRGDLGWLLEPSPARKSTILLNWQHKKSLITHSVTKSMGSQNSNTNEHNLAQPL